MEKLVDQVLLQEVLRDLRGAVAKAIDRAAGPEPHGTYPLGLVLKILGEHLIDLGSLVSDRLVEEIKATHNRHLRRDQ